MNLTECPTEAECIKAISKDLNNFYVISQRGDITISYQMKKAAFEAFHKEQQKYPFSSLAKSSDYWFIITQLRGWGRIPARTELPFGFTKEELKKIIE